MWILKSADLSSVGIFDVNPVLEGIAVRGIEIQMLSDLPLFLKENEVEIAILTLPKTKPKRWQRF